MSNQQIKIYSSFLHVFYLRENIYNKMVVKQ